MQSLRADPDGDLVLEVLEGEIRQHRPCAYQTIDGVRKQIEGHYISAGKNLVRFQLAAYDHARSVVIDPVITYPTYLGGDSAYGSVADPSGNAYVIGTIGATIFISELNPAGNTLVYCTYLGGYTGNHSGGIAVDSAGNAYVTGYTQSSDFPATSGSPPRSKGRGCVSVPELAPKYSAGNGSPFKTLVTPYTSQDVHRGGVGSSASSRVRIPFGSTRSPYPA